MRFDEFIDRVMQQPNIDSREEAVTITRAVLETLGGRLERKTRNGVVAQLPAELKEYMLERTENDLHYDVPEFYNRVGARAGLNYYDAAENAWKVLRVLREAIPNGELQNILDSLPAEYGALFGEDVPGRKRPRP